MPAERQNTGSPAPRKAPKAQESLASIPCAEQSNRRGKKRRRSEEASEGGHIQWLPTDEEQETFASPPQRSVLSDDSDNHSDACQSERSPPIFYKNNEPLSSECEDLFDCMRQKLTEDTKDNADKGLIYALRSRSNPGMIKIGKTIRTVQDRKAELEKCTQEELEIIDLGEMLKEPNYSRVEKLIHKSLRRYHHSWRCSCKGDGGREHGEWFEIDADTAKEVIIQWRTWMRSQPYCGEKLRDFEHARINLFREKHLKETIGQGKPHMQSLRLLNIPDWEIRKQMTEQWLFDQRPPIGKPGSRRDSLEKHWQSNVLFCLAIFWASYFFLKFVELLPAQLGSSWGLALANSTLLGIFGLLYAA